MMYLEQNSPPRRPHDLCHARDLGGRKVPLRRSSRDGPAGVRPRSRRAEGPGGDPLIVPGVDDLEGGAAVQEGQLIMRQDSIERFSATVSVEVQEYKREE